MHTEIATLKLRLAAMEARLAALECATPVPAQALAPVPPARVANSFAAPFVDPIAEAITEGMPQLLGRMSTKDVARSVGLPDDHSTLVRMGKVLSKMGIEKIMTNQGGRFLFPNAAPGAEGGRMDAIAPIEWLRGACGHVGATLAGHMDGNEVLLALGLSTARHRLATVYAAAQALGLKELPARGEHRTFDFGDNFKL